MMDKWKILIIEDEDSQREIIKVILDAEGFTTAVASDGRQGIDMFHRFNPDVVLCDLRLPDMEGTEVRQQLLSSDRHRHEFIIFTAHGTIESAVEAIKNGIFDYLTKPVGRDKLIMTVHRACERIELIRENIQLRKQLLRPFEIDGIIGKHPKLQKILEFVKLVSPLNVTVLITGETGTGKELVARAIHSASTRKDKSFQAVNCAAMPENLLESELFGYEKGAFTGAFSQRRGLIESCDCGTLFLDEIGELPMGPQSKLLRFMENKTIRRIGGSEEIPVDIRLIAATNKKLDEEIRDGRFRQDLFYRFRGFVIQLPPLRERASDIYLLAEYFIEKYNAIFNRSVRGVSKDALKILMNQPWPGNVRQLDATIEKAVLVAGGDVLSAADLDIPPRPSDSAADSSYFDLPQKGIALEEIERQVILTAMQKSGGSIAAAAKLLQTSYRTIEYRVKKYGISRDNPPNGEDNPPNG
jgi:DNA-binding NtrC family response regulator